MLPLTYPTSDFVLDSSSRRIHDATEHFFYVSSFISRPYGVFIFFPCLPIGTTPGLLRLWACLGRHRPSRLSLRLYAAVLLIPPLGNQAYSIFSDQLGRFSGEESAVKPPPPPQTIG